MFINEATKPGQNTTTITQYAQPLVYTADGNGKMNISTAKQPYFPTSNNGVNIYAVYPTNTASTWNNTTFTVASDQSTEANYKASDLMYGEPTQNPVIRTSSATALTFKHLLSKVTVTLVSGTGTPTLKGAVVELDVIPSTTVTKEKGTVVLLSDTKATSIKVMNATDSALSGSAVVVPQTLSPSFIKVTLRDGGVLTSQNLKDGSGNLIRSVVLTSGNEYKYTITVNLTSLDVTSTITPWTGTEATGEATMGN